MKYIVPFSAVIEVDAPNVVKAKQAAAKCRLIGNRTTFSSSQKERAWRVDVSVKGAKVGTPIRVHSRSKTP